MCLQASVLCEVSAIASFTAIRPHPRQELRTGSIPESQLAGHSYRLISAVYGYEGNLYALCACFVLVKLPCHVCNVYNLHELHRSFRTSSLLCFVPLSLRARNAANA